MAGIMAAGATVAAIGSNNGSSAAQGIGAAAMIGTYGWAIADSLNGMKDGAELPNQTPSDHLYTEFTLPGKMFVRKWLLIRKPTKQVLNNLVVELESSSGEKDRYRIVLAEQI